MIDKCCCFCCCFCGRFCCCGCENTRPASSLYQAQSVDVVVRWRRLCVCVCVCAEIGHRFKLYTPHEIRCQPPPPTWIRILAHQSVPQCGVHIRRRTEPCLRGRQRTFELYFEFAVGGQRVCACVFTHHAGWPASWGQINSMGRVCVPAIFGCNRWLRLVSDAGQMPHLKITEVYARLLL